MTFFICICRPSQSTFIVAFPKNKYESIFKENLESFEHCMGAVAKFDV